MDKQHFLELLHKFLAGKTSQEEDLVLNTYYELFETQPDVVALMSAEKKMELKGEIKNAIWQQIAEKETGKRPLAINTRIIRMAAAAILIAVCITTIFLLYQPPAKQPPAISFKNQQKGSKVLYLHDGSTVILSAGSILKYPPAFEGLSRREVYLEGEAFFDITHDPVKRFIVHAGKLEVAVLGTAFNIKSIPAEADITIMVSRGKVKISDTNKTLGLITKGQQIIYHKSDGNAIEKAVSANVRMDWKRQDLLIDDITVEEAARLLENRFDVKILFADDQVKVKRFTTVFLANENLEQVLRSICEFNGATYAYDQKQASVTISKINPHQN